MTIPELVKIRNTPIMFILGKERSGTTMLQAMLNAHPNIVAPHESRIIIFMYARYGKVKQWTEKILEEFCTELYEETRFLVFWKLNKEELITDLFSVKDELTYGLIFKIIYCKMAPAKDIKLIFDKNPVYYLFVPELQKIFPEAKYVHIVRDYRDNIVSHQRVLPSKNPGQLAYRWLRINKHLEMHKLKAPSYWTSIKYEDLVTEPINHMEEICRFIGMPFYASMVEEFSSKLSPVFHENADKKSFTKFHSNVYNPINTKPIAQWKEHMATEQVQIVESIAGPYGKQMYGYEISLPYQKPGTITLLKAKLVFTFFKTALRVIYRNRFIYKSGRAFAQKFIHKDIKKPVK
jgi:hypothetical protein